MRARARASSAGAPRAHVAQQELAVVDRGDERAARAPRSTASAPSRSARPTRSTPAAISAKAGSLAIVALPRSARAARCSASASGPLVAAREQERVELLDVLAGFEDEEVEKPDRRRVMPAPVW